MSTNKLKIINDPVHGFIKIPYEILYDVLEHRYFQRLRRISQTGLLSLVFPGATHTRFHHAFRCDASHVYSARNFETEKCKISDEEEKAALRYFIARCRSWSVFSRFRKSFDGRLASRETLDFIDEKIE